MAEKKGVGHAYNVDFLNVVFAASSIFLFLSVVWMVWDDYDRDWKNTQRRFAQLEYEVTQAQLQQAGSAVDRNKLQQLQAALEEAERTVAANQERVEELQNRLRDADNRLFRASSDYQTARATYEQDRYDFEASRNAGEASAEAKGQEVAALLERVNALNLDVEKITAERAAVQKELAQYTGQVAEIERQISELTAEEVRLSGRLDAIAPSALKDYFLNAPLLDFMAPTLKVQQVILPNIVDDVNFIRVAKIDRCRTCHLAIDRTGYEEYPQPFTTHPNLDQYVGSASPHPIERTGCTVCHEGMGQSVDFVDAAHTPATEEQKHEWEELYNWEEPHLWDYPMLPTGLTEASCAKCHKQEIYVPYADKLNVSYATYERAGCFACHKTRGFDTDMRKPGPILTKIEAKVTPEWVRTWIRNPRAVKPATWMPRFWYNSNNSAPEDAVRNEVEIDAIVAYLFANDEPHPFAVPNPPRGDAQRGENIVKTIGCLGCHVIGDESRAEAGPHRTFGQPLDGVGDKTTYEWIYNWVRDPKHYSPGTYMPDLRLTDAQVADVTTYLSTLKGGGGDPAKATPDQQAIDDVLMSYLRSVMRLDDATAMAATLNPEERKLELGRRAINRYGCFSCHDIEGFEDAQPIGTDLSEEGSKLVSRLEFGFVSEIPHTDKLAWFETKLHDPRVFDRGRELQPLEKLRMPDYDFSDEEVERLVRAIMSFQREIQPPAALPPRSARYDSLVSGRTLVHRRNCVGCHIIETAGGDYLTLVDDSSLGPPRLTPEGARVQPDWLYAFLRDPITIRPWLDVRMPTFGLDDPGLNRIIGYFGAISETIGPFRTHEITLTRDDRTVGRELFELLRCQQCHVLDTIPADQPTANLAPDLRMSPERLNPEWIVDWMRNPLAFLPGTRMPSYWPDYPESPFPQLGGDAAAQIRAVRDHLLTLSGGPSPRRTAGSVVVAATD
jgi:mono/diheme cytochrome c family protein